jgi:hypothetical protein
MKKIIKKIHIFSLLMVSLFVIISCEDNDDGVTNPGVSDELTARFTSVQEGKTVTFINISENATSYMWNFGDGTSSTLNNPEKRFTNGTYTVTLTAFNDAGKSNSTTDTFTFDGCIDETTENLDPANGDLNWTFLNANDDAGFSAFGSIEGGIVENPVLDNVNSSCNVFLYNKLSGCQTWSGAGYNLKTAIDFSSMNTNKVFKIKVLAQTQVTTVTFVLEKVPQSPIKIERQATITNVGEWEELTFDFSNISSGTFDNMLVYFDRNAPCDGDVYYFDDIIQTETP